ncbi:MAG: YcgN family cysteine cluster protein [Hyphomonadaceae bacterium]|nr:YcgN family cysteine cluster protein [Hyphomonadaceae bacterium]
MGFWQEKRLAEMSAHEWESLCDGCGKCCLIGLEDEDTGEIHLTDVACKLLDGQSCRCSDYENRQQKVPDCVRLTPALVPTLHWLPKTCAYRLVSEGKPLKWWHPLVSGDPESVHAAGASVRGKTRPERNQKVRNLIRRITEFPEAD